MKQVLKSLVIMLLILVAGCTVPGRSSTQNQFFDPTQARYFQGSQGVVARFDQLPSRLFYYGKTPRSSANDFPLSVEVWNKGASYTRGAVFISGYDPNIIQFDEIPIAQSYPGACTIRLGDYSLNQLSYFMQCGDGFTMRGHEGNLLDMISVRGSTWFDDSWLSNVIVDYQETNGGRRFDVTFDDLSFSAREHGLLLISLLSGLSFQAFLGREYLLAGDTYDYPGGESDYIEFTGHLINWPEGADQITQHFLLTNCYMYTTFAAPTVCIDPQPYSTNRKVCSPSVATWSNGQGAPVAITKVWQENTPRTAVFHIDIQNVGSGTVYDPGKLEKCSPYYPGGAKSSDLNTVWIGEVRINDRDLDCTPRNFIRLDQSGRGSFTCTYPIEYAELNSAYQTALVIELWYGYSEVLQRDVPIKKVT